MICDLSPAAAASGHATDEQTPLRRHAKTLRHILFCVPGRIARTARRVIVRLPDGFPHFETLTATYHAALALPGPRTPVAHRSASIPGRLASVATNVTPASETAR